MLYDGKKGISKPIAIVITAPNAPPVDTPKVELSAKGFLNSPCIAVPATESAAPTSADKRTRGMRTFSIMITKLLCNSDISPIAKNLFITIRRVSKNDIFTLPIETESKNININNIKEQIYISFLETLALIRLSNILTPFSFIRRFYYTIPLQHQQDEAPVLSVHLHLLKTPCCF